MYIGQAPVDAVVAEREFLVIDPQLVQHGRVYVVAVSRILGGLVRPLVAFAVAGAAFDAAAGEPRGEREWVVVAAF